MRSDPSSSSVSDVTGEEALERARDAGIHRLRIPTPFAVGPVNCYLIEDSPLTLVDTGPNSGTSLDELSRQLDALGYGIEDLELIVISHQHIDHLGLVDVLASRSGAEVAAIDVLVPVVERFPEHAEADDDFAADLMHRYGIPDDLIEALRTVSHGFRGWGAAAAVTRPLADGERLRLRNRELEVQLRPGHSPSDTLFWDAERAILLCADHLIGHISSNAVLARPLDGSAERPKSLIRYLRSLECTRGLPAEILLPGHGEPITDHVRLIQDRFAMSRQRAAELKDLIGERPRTAYELAQALWGNVAVTQAFLTLSEVVGHVDLLIQGGIVREVADGDVVRFEATGEGGEIEIPPEPTMQ
jgi:glyoxylase-like metal-dependent hydrolase (beta-lactamase superfamily II)